MLSTVLRKTEKLENCSEIFWKTCRECRNENSVVWDFAPYPVVSTQVFYPDMFSCIKQHHMPSSYEASAPPLIVGRTYETLWPCHQRGRVCVCWVAHQWVCWSDPRGGGYQRGCVYWGLAIQLASTCVCIGGLLSSWHQHMRIEGLLSCVGMQRACAYANSGFLVVIIQRKYLE